MPIICPAILAPDESIYRQQMAKVAHFAHRIQIDLTDGKFAQKPTIKPDQIWWPAGVKADIHLMYKQPVSAVKTLLKHKPHMIIVHAEADGDFSALSSHVHEAGIKVGVALLPDSSPQSILPALTDIDHVLIFSGELGHYGGRADLRLLKKVEILKNHKPELEIGWDGGVDDQNVSELIFGGVDVLDVGGFIEKSDNPAAAYEALVRIADETGTT